MGTLLLISSLTVGSMGAFEILQGVISLIH